MGLSSRGFTRPLDFGPRERLARMPPYRNMEVAPMTIHPDPVDVRDIVFRTLLEYDVPEDLLDDLDERIMLDRGRYMARSYSIEGFMAMWLIDVGLLQFYTDEGAMLRTVNLLEELQGLRVAA